jgi:CobQ/CobB/MinD/ParA nucleotide binding domain
MNIVIDLLCSDDALTRFGNAVETDADFWRMHLAKCETAFQSLILLRDWQGRFHLGVPRVSKDKELERRVKTLQTAIGALAHSDFVFYGDDLIDPAAIWEELDYLPLRWMQADDTDEGSVYPTGLKDIEVRVIERQIKEKIWTQTPPKSSGKARVVLFGIKGGVGRSSALVALAWYLATKGKKVLVLDMDFESPGISTSLLRHEDRPAYGVLDWFAAHALDTEVAKQLVKQEGFFTKSSLTQRLTEHGQGEIWVAPAHGNKTQDYVGKLGRLYQDTLDSSGLIQSYSQRILTLVETLEGACLPDVVLIDSRAGIDDTASVLLTQLDAQCYLFATSGKQTWAAYDLLFSHWKRKAKLIKNGEDFRARLKMVSALTPAENTVPGNFESLCESSYDLFLSHLYEAQTANEMGGFNYKFSGDNDAPHSPIRIEWNESLRNFDPLRFPDQLEPTSFIVFDKFVQQVERTLGGFNGN